MGVYANKLRVLLDDPASFEGSTGFKFARDQGLNAINTSNSAMRGSGNVLAALTKFGTGIAQQDYGNEFDRLLRATGEEDQNTQATEANAISRMRAGNDFTLGTRSADTADKKLGYDYSLGGRAADTADRSVDVAGRRADYDYSLGTGQLENQRRAGDQTFGLGMYRAGNDAQNNWWQYKLGSGRNANDAAANQNQFAIQSAHLPIDWYNAETRRGEAQSQDWWNPQRQARMPLTRRYV